MPEEIPKYRSDLTGPELDEALRNVGKVQDAVQRTESAAQTAEKYGQIVEQNQTAIQAIEDNLADVQGAAQNATDAKNAATSAAASASAASQSATDAEDAAQRAEAAAGINPNDYYTKVQVDSTLENYPTTDEVQGMIASAAPQVMTKEFVITNTVQNTYYAEYTQNISVDGYTPVSVGFRCSNADLNVYGCCLREGRAFVGFTNVKLTNLSSGIQVTLVVTYIKT